MKTILKLAVVLFFILPCGNTTKPCSLSQAKEATTLQQQPTLKGISLQEINTWSLTTRFDF